MLAILHLCAALLFGFEFLILEPLFHQLSEITIIYIFRVFVEHYFLRFSHQILVSGRVSRSVGEVNDVCEGFNVSQE